MQMNRVTMIGNVVADPEFRTLQGGGRIGNFRIAINEKWKDATSGEERTRVEYVPVAVFNIMLCDITEKLIRKGRTVFIEGEFRTRKWTDQANVDRYSTEVVLGRIGAKLVVMDRVKADGSGSRPQSDAGSWDRNSQAQERRRNGRDCVDEGGDFPEDPIPF